ncbi:MAG: hypothetical protein AABZ08_12270 [Planctomycetota bacterium]
MNRFIDTLIHKAKAVLCICLMVGLHVALPGCGQTAFSPANTIATPVSEADALGQTMAGTPMAGAKAIEFDQITKSFRVVYADGSARITGQVATDANGDHYVSQIVVTNGERAITLSINSSKQITDVVTAQGVWQRPVTTNAPSAPGAPTAPGARATGDVDQFVLANAELFSLSQQADDLGFSSSTDQAQPKADTAAFAPLLWAIGGLALWPIGAFATLLFVVELVVVLNVIF